MNYNIFKIICTINCNIFKSYYLRNRKKFIIHCIYLPQSERCQQNIRQYHRIRSIYQNIQNVKNSKSKATQPLIKSFTLYRVLNLADIWLIRINENTTIANNKYTNVSKKLEKFILFKNYVEVCFWPFCFWLGRTTTFVVSSSASDLLFFFLILLLCYM